MNSRVGRFVILVDTPGFNGSDAYVQDIDPRKQNQKLLKNIMKWLKDR